MKKRVLITGAAGFLGSHLCDKFIKEGFFVIGMDNLITKKIKNIEHLFKNPDFDFYHHVDDEIDQLDFVFMATTINKLIP